MHADRCILGRAELSDIRLRTVNDVVSGAYYQKTLFKPS